MPLAHHTWRDPQPQKHACALALHTQWLWQPSCPLSPLHARRLGLVVPVDLFCKPDDPYPLHRLLSPRRSLNRATFGTSLTSFSRSAAKSRSTTWTIPCTSTDSLTVAATVSGTGGSGAADNVLRHNSLAVPVDVACTAVPPCEHTHAHACMPPTHPHAPDVHPAAGSSSVVGSAA